jgi:hypothetical protein
MTKILNDVSLRPRVYAQKFFCIVYLFHSPSYFVCGALTLQHTKYIIC